MIIRIFKYIAIGILFLLGILIVVGNFALISIKKDKIEYAKTLEGMVKEINRNLHFKQWELGLNSISSIKVYLDNNNVVWECELDTTFFYPDRISILQPESMNAGLLTSGTREDYIDADTIWTKDFLKRHQESNLLYYFLFAKKESDDLFYEEIINRGFSQKWIHRSPFSNRHFEFVITNDEMKKMDQRCKSHRDEAVADFLRLYEKRQAELTKIASANADVDVEFYVSPTAFVYRYTLGKEYNQGGNHPIQNLRDLGNKLQNEAETDINTIPFFSASKEIAKIYNKNILLLYRDFQKTDSIQITAYQCN